MCGAFSMDVYVDSSSIGFGEGNCLSSESDSCFLVGSYRNDREFPAPPPNVEFGYRTDRIGEDLVSL